MLVRRMLYVTIYALRRLHELRLWETTSDCIRRSAPSAFSPSEPFIVDHPLTVFDTRCPTRTLISGPIRRFFLVSCSFDDRFRAHASDSANFIRIRSALKISYNNRNVSRFEIISYRHRVPFGLLIGRRILFPVALATIRCACKNLSLRFVDFLSQLEPRVIPIIRLFH